MPCFFIIKNETKTMNSIAQLFHNPAFVTTVGGIVTSLLIAAAKGISAIPLATGQTARLRVAALVLSAISALITRYLAGQLLDPNFWGFVATTGVTYVVAYLTHASVLNNPNTPSPAPAGTTGMPYKGY